MVEQRAVWVSGVSDTTSSLFRGDMAEDVAPQFQNCVLPYLLGNGWRVVQSTSGGSGDFQGILVIVERKKPRRASKR